MQVIQVMQVIQMRHGMKVMLEMQGSQVMQVIQVSLAHLWVDFWVIVYGRSDNRQDVWPSGPASCRIGPVRQVAGPESAAIQNLAASYIPLCMRDLVVS